MLERILRVRGFNGLQRREKKFRHISGVERDQLTMYGEVLKEVAELGEAIKTKQPWEVQCEVADIVINLAEMANAEPHPFSLQRAVNGKLRRNADKYDPFMLKYYQWQYGWTPEASMVYAKSIWDRRRDRNYFKQ